MPTQTVAQEANDRLVYASATAPTTATAPAGYTVVGLQTGSPVTRERAAGEARTKQGVTPTLGAIAANVPIGVLAGVGADDGTTILENAFTSKATVWLLITSGVVGSIGYHGQVKVTSVGEADEVDGAIGVTYTCAWIGSPTRFVAA